jgi:hypothetical protein
MTSSGQTWATADAERLTAEHIDALLAQDIAYLRVPGLLSSDWCGEISDRFLTFMADHPDHRIQMREIFVDTVVLGMNVFMRPDSEDGPSSLDEYFARVEHDRAGLRRMYEGGTDPYAVVNDFWRESGWKQLPALEDGRPYHSDVLWGMTGPAFAPPHVDTYHLETPCSLSRFPRRISCNTFVQTPDAGGNFRVYRQRKEDGDFDSARPPAYAEYAISAGDLIVFDAGHYHEVLPISGDRHRIFSHSAVLLDPGTREYSIIA